MNRFNIYSSKIIIFFFFSIIFFTSCIQQSTRKKIELDEDWTFFHPQTGKWYNAEVPGNIHTDLLNNSLIKDPFYDTNSDSMAWISEETWRYKKDFIIGHEFIERNIELIFDGVDTYSDIYLNGYKIGETDNMFRRWVFPIADSLKRRENRLEVIIYPSKKENEKKLAMAGIAIPDSRIFTRKAQYQYGWDWSPDFETAGIFKSVFVNSWIKLRINNVNIETKSVSKEEAVMVASIELESENYYNGGVKIISPFNEFDTLDQKLEIMEGKNIYKVEFPVKDPELWWCNGLGEPKLYDVKIQVSTKFRVEERNLKIGIRDIEFRANSDSIGQEFYFKINGVPVFAKGANWIPAEYFNGSNSYDNYRDLLVLAKDANFNMLRVWGGGIYENDEFYDICDSLGIMVWQDFMFACAMYPGDDEFAKSVEAEVDYQVNRLFNHPSIVLWCGNNEVSNGWFDWGWQKQYSLTPGDSIKIWNDYLKIFKKLIPETIAKTDQKRRYIHTSPLYGWGHDEANTHGDSHYWGVWWGMLDFDMYYEKTGRFMSEYGFQAFPGISSLSKFIPKDSLYLYSGSLNTHQKHNTGFQTIHEYMAREYRIPKEIEDYAYVSQVLQAEGVQKAFDAHISKMPYCMGTLFWQFNDCWPVVSWSAVDYYKQPKALYYYAKKSFDNVHISVIPEDYNFNVYVTNHNNRDINSKIIIKHIGFNGRVMNVDSVNFYIPKLRSTQITFADSITHKIRNNSFRSFGLIEVIDMQSENKIKQRSFVNNKNMVLLLPDAEIEINSERQRNNWRIEINSDVFVKNLYIYDEKTEGIFSDNYFDVIPGETKVIYFYPETVTEKLMLNYKSMNKINHDGMGALYDMLPNSN